MQWFPSVGLLKFHKAENHTNLVMEKCIIGRNGFGARQRRIPVVNSSNCFLVSINLKEEKVLLFYSRDSFQSNAACRGCQDRGKKNTHNNPHTSSIPHSTYFTQDCIFILRLICTCSVHLPIFFLVKSSVPKLCFNPITANWVKSAVFWVRWSSSCNWYQRKAQCKNWILIFNSCHFIISTWKSQRWLKGLFMSSWG